MVKALAGAEVRLGRDNHIFVILIKLALKGGLGRLCGFCLRIEMRTLWNTSEEAQIGKPALPTGIIFDADVPVP